MNGIPGRAFGRRDLLRGAVALPFAQALGADDGERLPAGLIGRQRSPENLEFPFSTLDTRRILTPNESFYVRTHFEVPEIGAKTWNLKVEGEVERPFELGYDELRRMPSQAVTALLECSGNGRVFLEPPQVSIRWELGGVSTAEWKGVPLTAVLEWAGVRPNAVEVILEGADKGEFTEPNPKRPGVIPYARSLPLAKAPEVLLAYEMNGEPLPPRPIRRTLLFSITTSRRAGLATTGSSAPLSEASSNRLKWFETAMASVRLARTWPITERSRCSTTCLGDGNCTRDSNSTSLIPQTTCETCPLGLSDLCRDDAAIREIVGSWHRLTPEVREKIMNLVRSSQG